MFFPLSRIMVLEIIKLFVWTVWTTKSILLISVSAGIGNLSLSYDGGRFSSNPFKKGRGLVGN